MKSLLIKFGLLVSLQTVVISAGAIASQYPPEDDDKGDLDEGFKLAKEFSRYAKQLNQTIPPQMDTSSHVTNAASATSSSNNDTAELPKNSSSAFSSSSKDMDTPDEDGTQLAKEFASLRRPISTHYCTKNGTVPTTIETIVNKYMNQKRAKEDPESACQQVLRDYSSSFYIGNTKAFIPAMKRCMMDDDVVCYDVVMSHFAHENRDKPWRVKQLPALAAQLGASAIFQKLGVDATHPLWNKWMTRAAARHRFGFLSQVDKKLVASLKGNLSEPLTYHHILFYAVKWNVYRIDNEKSISFSTATESLEPVHSLKRIEKLVSDVSKNFSWVDPNMMTNTDSYPTVDRVFQVLASRRVKSLEALKQDIIATLSKGIYLMDDILEDASNLFTLWWRYGNEQDNDAGRFIKWLMDEGAPMDLYQNVQQYLTILEHHKVDRQDYTTMPSKITLELPSNSNSKYEKWFDTVVNYSAGSGTNLIRMLLQSTQTVSDLQRLQKDMTPHAWYFYKKRFDADVLHPSILKLYLPFWSATQTKSHFVFLGWITSLHASSQLPTFLAENGLSMPQIDLLQALIVRLPDTLTVRAALNDALSYLKKAVSNSQKRRLVLSADEAHDYYVWGLSLFSGEEEASRRGRWWWALSGNPWILSGMAWVTGLSDSGYGLI